MKLKPIRANMTELDLGFKGYEQIKVLFSYETPVAYSKLGPEGLEYFKTNKKWSNTTTKHINSWVPSDAVEVDQEALDTLSNGV